ncbi:MAG: hormogonium polysaccharide biosynthesis glycosyltransferase HpsE [Cyanobacteria bacterium J06627_28]
MIDFSVAIRTYNRAEGLPRLFAALRSQKNTQPFRWEIVIVDNNSTDDTAQLIEQLAPTMPVPVRYQMERRQGASFARQAAILEAQGPLIGFLDDDNIPAADWVSRAYAFGQAHPKAAAFGSQIHGSFEVAPPPNFERIAGFFPVVERSHDVCFTAGKRRLSNHVPPGAGLVIRKWAWLEHVPFDLKLKGPIGNTLHKKGEDTEALLHLKKAGWEIWFHAQLHIVHLIGQERLTPAYLKRFFQGIGYSRYTIRMITCQPALRLPMTLLHMLNDCRRLLGHCLTHLGQRSLVAYCEYTLLRSSLVSPLVTLKERLLSRSKTQPAAERQKAERQKAERQKAEHHKAERYKTVKQGIKTSKTGEPAKSLTPLS